MSEARWEVTEKDGRMVWAADHREGLASRRCTWESKQWEMELKQVEMVLMIIECGV